MPLLVFSLFTVLGSGLWNTLLIGVGAALGTQHHLLEQWLEYLDLVVYSAIAIAVVVLIARRVREARRMKRTTTDA